MELYLEDGSRNIIVLFEAAAASISTGAVMAIGSGFSPWRFSGVEKTPM